MELQQILRTVLAEHEDPGASGSTLETLQADVEARLSDISTVPAYTESSEQLSIVSFRCMLQDTGYPPEVYLPANENATSQDGAIDMSQLRERWVGWAVEVPGEQAWVKGGSSTQTNGAMGTKGQLPKEVHGKYPLPATEGSYLGALVKVYDEDATFKPATVHTFIGILSTASLPSAIHPSEDESEVIVPSIHVIKIEPELDPSALDHESAPEGLIEYLSSAFTPPDRLAGQLLLLSLLSYPAIRPTALPPLGTLSLNFLRKSAQSTERLSSVISSISQRVVTRPLSLPLLHSHPFVPTSTDSTLESGLLQLAPRTVLVVNEDEMGQGGTLQEKAIKNLQSLVECVKDQMVKYEYPYMDGLKMECSIKVIILSEGKSLIPVDINLPVSSTNADEEKTAEPDLPLYRKYLEARSSPSHANKFNIPDSVALSIQDDFVTRRKDSTTAEEGLKRRMRLARLMAIATASGTLSEEVWAQTLDLDRRIEARLDQAKAQAQK